MVGLNRSKTKYQQKDRLNLSDSIMSKINILIEVKNAKNLREDIGDNKYL